MTHSATVFVYSIGRQSISLRYLSPSSLSSSSSSSCIAGGVQEVTLMDPNNADELVLYLQNRKGFIKQALTTGSPIVPAFAFNTDGSYKYWIPRGDLINGIARSIGFLPLFFAGRFGLPFGIPFPQDIHVVIGRPIYVPKEGEDVKSETVEKFHKLFLHEMEGLFERHKEEAGYGHRKLKIL
jgi:hypothetical protein